MRLRQNVRRVVFGAALLVSVGVTSSAQAQTRSGWALNRYEPSPMGDTFFLAEHPWYSSTRVFSVGIYGDYAINPLHIEDANDPTRQADDITGMFTLHVGAQVSFLDRFGIHLSLPVSLMQSGPDNTALVPAGQPYVGAADGPAIGDLRAGLRVRIFGHADKDAFSLHVGATFWAPIGQRASNMGDEAIRIEPRLTLAGRGGPLRWSLGGGFMIRPDNIDVLNIALGSELRITGAVGIVAADDRFMIGPEIYVATPLRDLPTSQGGGSAFFARSQWAGEVLIGASYLIADAFRIGLAGGPGISDAAGVPTGRLVFNLSYAPITRPVAGPVDTDGDGIFDPDDVCPTTPQGDHPDPTRRGCPLTDTDSDGVFDNEDQCVNEPMGPNPDPTRRGCPSRDRDGDGVPDPADQCVDVPQGVNPDPTRPGCPAGDRDSDGVFDHEDQCPDQPKMPFPDPNRNGCPLPDADHDQVPEPPDACPGVPGVPSPDPARNGCPNANVSIDGGQIRILEQVFFDTDRDTIKRRSFRILQAVADVLAAAPHIRRVSVDGHTDNRSTEEHNLDLSQRRAASVVTWLTQHGVEASRLESHGYGPSRPIDTNETNAGRARNRRVEFVIIDPPQPRDAQAAPAVAVPTPAASPAPAPGRRHRRRH